MRQASLFSPFNWAPPAESHCDGAAHANARHTTGNVPGELNASYKSPSKTNSMTRLRRSKKLLTISLSVHFHFLQAKISLNKGLQLLATHVIYLVYIVNNDLRGTNPYRASEILPRPLWRVLSFNL